MSKISDLAYKYDAEGNKLVANQWRHDLMPASFRNAYFHVQVGAKENGRRIVLHEFPKREEPYSEDMGRIAFAFTVRGYCVCYPFDANELFNTDYRISRDLLLAELEREGSGVLQLPTLPPMDVVCRGYRLTEEDRLGGYCAFDMQFVEQGKSPFAPERSTEQTVEDVAQSLEDRAVDVMSGIYENIPGFAGASPDAPIGSVEINEAEVEIN